ncbi:cytochrome C oxidase subunit II [Falsiroseomonas bella]|uniref:Cytochrome C oxidase subunit II n=1 Tax=Falsiroseomonas bella TaxID=2184016 RepID=A0A317FA98_9PROT|nr:cytochrome C oxidase subunit II [Falsiroseomonas bella]
MQSVLSPAGPYGAQIAQLTWLLFGGGAVIFGAVLLFLLVALLAGPRSRATLGSRRFVLAAGVGFPVAVLGLLLVHILLVGRAVSLPVPGDAQALRIEMIGRQFWWEVRYPETESGAGFVTANEVHIPVGRDVVLEVASGDVIHSVWIPALHGKIDMIPGRVNRRVIRADRPGVMRGQCTEYCGVQHALMAFFVVARTPQEYEDWLQRQRRPAAEPEDEFLAMGRRVFGEVGCGACHAVRGTEWTARLGPDLTHVGSRLSLAAGALDNHRGTLAGWIAGAQDLKPGNAMPSFAAALDGPELRAVAAWLESLK